MFQPFQLLFYKGNSLVGKLIRLFSKDYSHCAMFLDQFHTLELAWNKPSVIAHFAYKKKSYDVYQLNIQLNDEQKQIILQYITNNIKSGYDWIFLITRMFYLIFGTPIKNSKKTKTCDEMIVDAFRQIGIHLVDESTLLTPDSLSKSIYLTKIY